MTLFAPPAPAALREILLQCADDRATLDDQFRCGDLLAAAGHTGAAQMLRAVADLRMGVSGPVGPREGEKPSRSKSSLGIAVEQLTLLVAATDDATPLPSRGRDLADTFLEAGSPEAAGLGWVPGQGADLTDVGSLCERLRAALRQPLDARLRQELSVVLSRLQTSVMRGPVFDAKRHVGTALPVLAAGVALGQLRGFLDATLDLASDPFGSVGLFHAAGRLGRAGLGPWFTDTTHLLRGGRDLFGLIQLAAGGVRAAAVGTDCLERWSFLLSQQMSGAALRDLVDELADIGAMRAVWGISERAARRRKTPPDLLWCIRDAGLDDGDLELALRAQKLVLRDRPYSAVEWIVLGDMEVTAGNSAEAEKAFLHALDLDRRHRDWDNRLHALRDGSLELVRMESGFGTPPYRKRLRLARRQAQRLGAV